METIGFIAALLIGVSLGLVGSGGSSLAVPVFVYLLGVKPGLATTYSLLVVGATAAVGAYRYARQGLIDLKLGVWFAVPAILSVTLMRRALMPAIPHTVLGLSKDDLIMGAFGVLMVFAATAMIRSRALPDQTREPSLPAMARQGFFTGLVTGAVGAGGGFLIVPSLALLGGLPMKRAVGTSLLVIAGNSLVGFASDALGGVTMDTNILFGVTASAMIGLGIGTWIAPKVSAASLKPAFGYFLLLIGSIVMVQQFAHV